MNIKSRSGCFFISLPIVCIVFDHLPKKSEVCWLFDKMAYNRQVLHDHRQVNYALHLLVLSLHTKQRFISFQQNLEYLHVSLDNREMDGAKTVLICIAHFWLSVDWHQWVE